MLAHPKTSENLVDGLIDYYNGATSGHNPVCGCKCPTVEKIKKERKKIFIWNDITNKTFILNIKGVHKVSMQYWFNVYWPMFFTGKSSFDLTWGLYEFSNWMKMVPACGFKIRRHFSHMTVTSNLYWLWVETISLNAVLFQNESWIMRVFCIVNMLWKGSHREAAEIYFWKFPSKHHFSVTLSGNAQLPRKKTVHSPHTHCPIFF